MKRSYTITGIAGVTYGEYSGLDAADALEALARDAGYASWAGWCRTTGASQGDWTTDPAAFKRGNISLLVAEVV